MDTPVRRALLVGVDAYPNLRNHQQLRSCGNDARLMRDTLIRGYGFRGADVTVLIDQDATHDRVLEELDRLRAHAGGHDAVVFYFSGHGSRVADPSAPSGFRESLVPHDSGRDPYPNRDIGDVDIHTWLLGMQRVTGNVAVIADTCFAGGAVRGATWKAIPDDCRPWPFAAAAARARAAVGAVMRDAAFSGFLPADTPYVLLAACRPEEHAKELRTRPLSAFTSFLSAELQRAPAGATYRDVVEQVRLAVEREVTEQTPQVEGARDRVLFGETTARPAPFLSVLARLTDDGVVDLDGGGVQGVEVGSLWAVHPAGTRQPGEDGALGLVRMQSVEPMRCRGAVVEASAPLVEGMRAFERTPGPNRMRLAVVPPAGGAPALEAAIARSPLLVPATAAGVGTVRIAAAEPPRSAAPAEEPGPRVQEPSWVVLNEQEELVLPPVARRLPEASATLVGRLEDLARARNLRTLAPGAADMEACAPAALRVDLLRRRPGQLFEAATPDAGGEVVYHEGDQLGLRIRHQAAGPLQIHVFDIGLLGAVTSLYPVPGACDGLAAGYELELWTRPGEEMTICFPDGFTALARAAGRRRLEGSEALKIVATAGTADLAGWQSPATVRGGSGERAGGAPRQRGGGSPQSGGGSLAGLLRQALGDAGAMRSDGVALPAGDRWSVRTVTFLVRGELPAGG